MFVERATMGTWAEVVGSSATLGKSVWPSSATSRRHVCLIVPPLQRAATINQYYTVSAGKILALASPTLYCDSMNKCRPFPVKIVSVVIVILSLQINVTYIP